ncbi:hypothetical protein J6590_033067 [Homalodisca vitripennis]|nr:hypothetical protein J6590_033067 [Homalodisca vitripennis]
MDPSAWPEIEVANMFGAARSFMRFDNSKNEKLKFAFIAEALATKGFLHSVEEVEKAYNFHLKLKIEKKRQENGTNHTKTVSIFLTDFSLPGDQSIDAHTITSLSSFDPLEYLFTTLPVCNKDLSTYCWIARWFNSWSSSWWCIAVRSCKHPKYPHFYVCTSTIVRSAEICSDEHPKYPHFYVCTSTIVRSVEICSDEHPKYPHLHNCGKIFRIRLGLGAASCEDPIGRGSGYAIFQSSWNKHSFMTMLATAFNTRGAPPIPTMGHIGLHPPTNQLRLADKSINGGKAVSCLTMKKITELTFMNMATTIVSLTLMVVSEFSFSGLHVVNMVNQHSCHQAQPLGLPTYQCYHVITHNHLGCLCLSSCTTNWDSYFSVSSSGDTFQGDLTEIPPAIPPTHITGLIPMAFQAETCTIIST